MIRIFAFPMIFVFAAPVFAQQNDGTGQSNSHIYGDGFNARAREIPFTPGETEGSYYLYQNWSPGMITMDDGEEVRDVFLKYDFQKRVLEIKTDTAYYSLNAHDTERFTIYDDEDQQFRQFVAAQDYQVDGTPLVGVLELLHEGTIGLVAKVSPKLIEANYSGALSGGSKSDKIVKEKEYFLVKNHQLIALPTKKKEAIAVLQPFDSAIEQFMKKTRLKPKREEDLISIVQHLNQ